MATRPTRRDLIAILFKHRHLFLLLLLGAMAGAGVAITIAPTRFAAHVALVLPAASSISPDAAMAEQAALLNSPSTARLALDAAGRATIFPDLRDDLGGVDHAIARLDEGLTVASLDGGRVLSVSLALETPDAAARALNALIRASLAGAASLEAQAGGAASAAYVALDAAEPPSHREPLHKLPIMAAAFAAGLILALAGVITSEGLDDRFTTPWQTQNVLSLPVLASFTRHGETAKTSSSLGAG